MKISIIGAGISGLYAGHLLLKAGYDVEILEASDRAGGRIYSFKNSSGAFAELGAELVYAPNAPLIKTLKRLGQPILKTQGVPYYILENQCLTRSELGNIPDAESVVTALEEIENYSGEEMSLQHFFEQQAYYNNGLSGLVNAFACEYGTTADQLGVQALADEESTWSGGDDEFYSTQPLDRVVEYFLGTLEKHIRYKKQVKKVDYSDIDGKVIILDQDDHIYSADKVLVTVNIGILKAKDIAFSPPLSRQKLEAIKSIGIDTGIKAILQFSKKWWPDDLMTIEGGQVCFEYLATRNYAIPTLTCFVMGDNARSVNNLSEQRLIDLLLDELDQIIGQGDARRCYQTAYLKNWGDDQYHKGAYSFPTPYTGGKREILAEPVVEKLYFIGEACNTRGHAATIHGAMETAESACENIIQADVHA